MSKVSIFWFDLKSKGITREEWGSPSKSPFDEIKGFSNTCLNDTTTARFVKRWDELIIFRLEGILTT